jgi:hypothetical protein
VISVCDASDGDASPIVVVDPQYEGPEPQAASLGDLVTWIRDAYEAGVWWRDADGVWHWRKDRIPTERVRAAPAFF